MTKTQSIMISIAILLLAALFFFIIVSEHGLADLKFLKQERRKLIEKSERLTQDNLSIGIEIDRLKHDPEYIENVARKELGMIGEDEVILKTQSQPEPKQ
ncbi:MAG: septum formation initiator family protein [Desulfobacterales bacterium]|jgi:cell division protein FtsB